MSETSTLQGILKSIATGPAWYGPSVAQTLEGITADQAAARPVANAHSIWELLLHMDAWQVFTLRMCEGNPIPMLEGDADWPPVSDTNNAAWTAAKDAFTEHTQQLNTCFASWDDAKLRETVPGREFPFKVLLHGIAHHNVYHAGQIGMLKKA